MCTWLDLRVAVLRDFTLFLKQPRSWSFSVGSCSATYTECLRFAGTWCLVFVAVLEGMCSKVIPRGASISSRINYWKHYLPRNVTEGFKQITVVSGKLQD